MITMVMVTIILGVIEIGALEVTLIGTKTHTGTHIITIMPGI